MSSRVLPVLLACLACTALGKVREIGKDEYETILRSGASMPTLMYAPWCGHCKAFKPQFRLAGQDLDGLQDLYMIDCTNESSGASEVCNTNEVRGFPTIKMFNPASGEAIEYEGARDAESFKSWVIQNMKKDYSEVKTADELEAAIEAARGQERPTVFIVTKSKVITRTVVEIAHENRDKADFVVLGSASTATLKAAGEGALAGLLNDSGFSVIVMKAGKLSSFQGEPKGFAIRTFLADNL